MGFTLTVPLTIKPPVNGKKKNNGKMPKMKPAILGGIIAGIAVVVIAVAAIVMGSFVNNLDTIYPNITIGEVDVSGMTVDEASRH